jgi:tetratricopeptide (TPR) repeat protein
MPSALTDFSPQDLERIFQQSWDLAPSDRPAFLATACGGNESLRQSVEKLLNASTQADGNPLWKESALSNEARFTADQSGHALLDRYQLLERIGAGGMGVVYRAVRSDREYSKQVAIKIVQSGDLATMSRLRQERQILAGLEHPNIARLLDGGSTQDGLPFLAMEYVDGLPIDRYVAERKPAQRELLELFRKICDAVSYAHRNLIVHRDLKPSNILVTAAGEPMLLDFGIAKLLDGSSPRTLTGMAAMTPAYASPEQVAGGPITTATDIYSLGVLLYEVLSGARPYRDTTNPLELAQAIATETPLPLSVRANRRFDNDLENIVQMALRKEPERRYPSVDQFSEDVRRYLAGYPVAARTDTSGYRARKFAGRNKGALIGAGLVVAALVAGIAATAWEARLADQRFNDVRQLAHAVVFDYHDAIEPLPGSTPVRQKMVKDALVYLDKLSQQGADPSLQREVVESYVKIANVQGNGYYSNLGDSNGAMASVTRAIALGERLTRQDHSPANRRALASAYVSRGDLQAGAGKLREASQDYGKAMAIEEAVVREVPADFNSRVQLAQTLGHAGDVLGGEGQANLGRTAEALANYRRSVEIAEGLAKEQPGSRIAKREVYDSYLALAGTERTAGHLAGAEVGYRNAVATIRQIANSNNASSSDQVEVAGACLRLVQTLIDNGKPREAVPYALSAASIMQAQVKGDPANALYRRNLEVTETHVANVLRRSGDAAGAALHAQAALSLSEKLSS